MCSAQSGIRSCRFVYDSPPANPQPGMLHQAKLTRHTFTHSISQLTGGSRHHEAQAEEEHSTLHTSTGSQQTSQGAITRHCGSLFGRSSITAKLELHKALKGEGQRRRRLYTHGTAERFVWEGEAGWKGWFGGRTVGQGANTRSLTGCRFGTS